MKIFVSSSYSSKVDYKTGNVDVDFKKHLEGIFKKVESFGHTVYSALREDGYRINTNDPAKAFSLDEKNISDSDVLLALVTRNASAGVQTEIGMAVAQRKAVIIAHEKDVELGYFNKAIISAGQAKELVLPIVSDLFTRP